jgi:nucleoside-diphosphate-sugar epimerase
MNSAGAAETGMVDREWLVSVHEPVLVTGSNGFIGSKTVKTLLDYGFQRVRCFVRPSTNLRRFKDVIYAHPRGRTATELVEGNLLSRDDCARAMDRIAVVFHLAAGMDKSFAASFMNSVLTTRNLLDAAVAAGTLKRFVNISSFAVYSNLHTRRGSLFDERIPLETAHNERQDPYAYAKLKQEQLVQRYHRCFKLPYVILRPGAVWGPGKPSLTGRIGINTFGFFLHLGGSNRIPMTYVDNCAEAIVRAGVVRGIDAQVFNVVDDELPTSREFLRLYKRHVRRFVSIPVPYQVAYLLSAMWERYSNWSQGQLPPRFNRRRASAEWKAHRYSNDRLKELLGWAPQVPFAEASRLFFASFEQNA